VRATGTEGTADGACRPAACEDGLGVLAVSEEAVDQFGECAQFGVQAGWPVSVMRTQVRGRRPEAERSCSWIRVAGVAGGYRPVQAGVALT
jgi:hypothetical protein